MKHIPVSEWDRKETYEHFSAFTDPVYSITVRMDVTGLVAFCRQEGHSFFSEFLYLLLTVLNASEPFRLRVIDGEVIEYDFCNANFTVDGPGDRFTICRTPWTTDREAFCDETHRVVREARAGIRTASIAEEKYDDLYFSCLPWLDFESITCPVSADKNDRSIPRIGWGKYVCREERYSLSLCISVDHSLVDGRSVCNAFNAIQQALDAFPAGV